jgi:hypothetical protein
MRILVEIKNLEGQIYFSENHFLTLSSEDLYTKVGHSNCILCHQGKIILNFECNLLDLVANLTLGYFSLLSKEATNSGIYNYHDYWDRLIDITFKNDKFDFKLKKNQILYDQIEPIFCLSHHEYKNDLQDFVKYSFEIIEYIYDGIINNSHYINFKIKANNNLNI